MRHHSSLANQVSSYCMSQFVISSYGFVCFFVSYDVMKMIIGIQPYKPHYLNVMIMVVGLGMINFFPTFKL
jgi:hypothetical protein